jgi:predicted Zn-dependent protease with MMP-like domain
MNLSDEAFDHLISRAMDELPQKYIEGLNNVAVTYEDEPSEEQKQKYNLDEHHILLGLYEGIPLTQRGNNYTFVLPDKITLFKHSILAVTHDEASLFEQIKRTLWHEIAHYYGLNHDRIHAIQKHT